MSVHKRFSNSPADVLAFCFLFITIVSVYNFEFYVVITSVCDEIFYQLILRIIATLLVVNIMGNLAMMMLSDTTTRNILLPSILRPCWRFCPSCEANSPPRSFHCDTCQACILRRDHHCTFVGHCVGLKNFRYFFVFLFYLALGSLYATILNMFFIWNFLGGFSVFAVITHIIPCVLWLGNYISFETMFYALMSVISFVGFLFVINIFILYMQQMLKNQTTFERAHCIIDYDLGWRQNVIELLGSQWHLVWLFPSIKSPLPSDGLSFKLTSEFSSHSGKIK